MSEKKPKNPVKEPKRAKSDRILRGGCRDCYVHGLESGARNSNLPSIRSDFNYGFRIARTKK